MNYHETWIGWMVVHWLGNNVVVCLNLSLYKIMFLFAKIIFGMDGKG